MFNIHAYKNRAPSPINRNGATPAKARGRGLSVGDTLRQRQELPPFEEPIVDVPEIPDRYRHERNDSVSSYRYGGHGGHAGPSTAANVHQSTLRQEQVGDASRIYHHGRNTSASSSKASQQVSSPERGRTLQKKHNLPWHELDDGLPPVAQSTEKSNVTTMSDFINVGNAATSSGARSMSRHKSPPKAATAMSTDGKGKRRPEPLDLQDTRRYAALVGPHANIHPVHHPIHHPLTPMKAEHRQVMEDGSSSVYTPTPLAPSHDDAADSPPRAPHNPQMVGVNILQRYSEWRNTAPESNAAANGSTERHNSTMGTPNATDQALQGPSAAKSSGAMPLSSPVDFNAPPFTPLTPFIMGGNVRKASKTMIGEKGWLEDTAARAVKKPERQKNTTGFFDNVKKTARKIVRIHCSHLLAPKLTLLRLR